MDNLMTTLVHSMGRRTDTKLTEQHWEILEYVQKFYERNRVGPLYDNIKKNTGADKKTIEALFPSGLKSVYTWVGIPIQTPDKICKKMAEIEVDDFREVYFDHNSTTYIRDEVRDMLVKRLQNPMEFGNPSSSTDIGSHAFKQMHRARARIAKCLKVKADEVTFTGCGSESNNFAIKGIALQHIDKPGHIITTSIEHSSVLEPIRYLEGLGFDVTYLPCRRDGCVTAKSLKDAIRKDTILVSIMAVNNEIGTINPIKDMGEICKKANIPFMVDAIQAFGKIPLDPKADGISILTLSGHKIYAPKGIGAIYIDANISLTPLIHGGGQEMDRRSGTENVDFVSAFGYAAQLIHKEREQENVRLLALRDYFLQKLKHIEPNYIVNGSLSQRIPNNLNIGFPNVDSGSLLLSLNQIGIYVSAGSACHAGSEEDSHVIKALGVDTKHYGSIRFSFGLRSSKEEIDYLFQYFGEILSSLREEQRGQKVA